LVLDNNTEFDRGEWVGQQNFQKQENLIPKKKIFVRLTDEDIAMPCSI